jgi:hypothetical protein
VEVSPSDGIAGLALIVSLYTAWRQHGTDKLAKRLNKLQIDKEEADNVSSKRADLAANFVKTGKHSHQFKIYNRGKGVARNIRIDVLAGAELLDVASISRRFPFPSLDTHQSISILASVHYGSPRRATVRLKWNDDAGGGEKEVHDDAF